jgi:hypothetical protein
MSAASAHYYTGFQALNTQLPAFLNKDLLLEEASMQVLKGVNMQADATVDSQG